jgi:hypothetical protein
MRAAAVALPVLLLVQNATAQPNPAPPVTAQAPAPLRPRLTDEVIKNAVHETLAVQAAPPRHEADVLAGDKYQSFSEQFSAAKVPDCLHQDGLKRQPTFFFTGLLALPFVAVAKLRGKCQ